MTSTNDGKVKSHESSGAKGKSHFIELYKCLDANLNSDCDLSSRTAHLCAAWRHVHSLCAHSAPSTHPHLLAWIQRHTSRAILQTEWQSPSSKENHETLERALKETIKEAEDAILARGNHLPWESQLHERAVWFLSVLASPWDHPVLKVLLDPKQKPPTDEQVLEWLREERGVPFMTRLRQLALSKGCDDLALTLASVVMDRVRAGTTIVPDSEQLEDTRERLQEKDWGAFERVLRTEAGFTQEVLDFITDIELVMLHKRDKDPQCIHLAKATPLRFGHALVERLASRLELAPKDKKIWKNSREVAIIVAQVIIARCMMVGLCGGVVRTALYWCGRAVARLVLRPRLPKVASALAAPAATARHLYTLAAAHHAQLADCEEQRGFVCELYIRAITTGMNELEKLKAETTAEKEKEARQTEQTLATWFIQLGTLLSSSARVKCECALTAFSVHPSPAMYERIKQAPPLPTLTVEPQETEKKDQPNSDFGSWANDSRQLTNFVKTSETLNLKVSQKMSNVLSTAIFTEGEGLGLSPELSNDLAVLLSGPRVKTLSWDMERELLLENCRLYMERTSFGTRALTTELRYLNLDPKTYQHLPEEEDEGEDDLYYGIEKGYEHLVEFEPQPEEIWQDAYSDPDKIYSADSDIEDRDYGKSSSSRRKKKSKHLSESDTDPLSMIAENQKEDKKKERPHGEDKKKERPHSEGKKKERPHSEGKKKERPHSEDKKKERPHSEDKKKERPHSKERSKEPKKKSKVKDPLKIKTKEPITKEKKIRKKKDPLKAKSSLNLKQLLGVKVGGMSFEEAFRKSLKVGASNTPLDSGNLATDSDYDSQGKSSFYSEGTEPEVAPDPYFPIDDLIKSLETKEHVKESTTPYPIDDMIKSMEREHVKKSITKLLHYRKQKSAEEAKIRTSTEHCQPNLSSFVGSKVITMDNKSIPNSNSLLPRDTDHDTDKKTYSKAQSKLVNQKKSMASTSNADLKKNQQKKSTVVQDSNLPGQSTNLQSTMPSRPDPTPANPLQSSSPVNKPSTAKSNAYFDTHQNSYQRFLMELQQTKRLALAKSNNTVPTATPKKSETKETPVVSNKIETTTSQCAKPSQQKIENAPNTFARRNYRHKTNKQVIQSPEAMKLSIDREIDERIANLTLSKMKYLQSHNLSITRVPDTKEEIPKESPKVEVQMVENGSKNLPIHRVSITTEPIPKESPKAEVQRVEIASKNLTISRVTITKEDLKESPKVEVQMVEKATPACNLGPDHPFLSNMLRENVVKVARNPAYVKETEQTETTMSTPSLYSSLSEQDQADVLHLLLQQNKLNSKAESPITQNPSIPVTNENETAAASILRIKNELILSSPTQPAVSKLPNVIPQSTVMQTANMVQIPKPRPKRKPKVKLCQTKEKTCSTSSTAKTCIVNQQTGKVKENTKQVTAPSPAGSHILNISSVNIKSTAGSHILNIPVINSAAKLQNIDKASPSWTTVLDKLRDLKNPSRGPTAIDLVLGRDAQSHSTNATGALRQQRIIKSNSMPASSEIPQSILDIVSEKPMPSTSAASVDSNKNIPKVKSSRPRKPRTKVTVINPPREVLEVKKPTIQYPKKEPLGSGIPHSDYEMMLGELFDDDLLQEIDESPVQFTRQNEPKNYAEETETTSTTTTTTPIVNKEKPQHLSESLVQFIRQNEPNNYAEQTQKPTTTATSIITKEKPRILSNVAISPGMPLSPVIINALAKTVSKNIPVKLTDVVMPVRNLKATPPPPTNSPKNSIASPMSNVDTLPGFKEKVPNNVPVANPDPFAAQISNLKPNSQAGVVSVSLYPQPQCVNLGGTILITVPQNTQSSALTLRTSQNVAFEEIISSSASIPSRVVKASSDPIPKFQNVEVTANPMDNKIETVIVAPKNAMPFISDTSLENQSVDKLSYPVADNTGNQQTAIKEPNNLEQNCSSGCINKMVSVVPKTQNISGKEISTENTGKVDVKTPKDNLGNHQKTIERSKQDSDIAEQNQAKLNAKRSLIINRQIEYRCNSSPIALSYTPLLSESSLTKVTNTGSRNSVIQTVKVNQAESTLIENFDVGVLHEQSLKKRNDNKKRQSCFRTNSQSSKVSPNNGAIKHLEKVEEIKAIVPQSNADVTIKHTIGTTIQQPENNMKEASTEMIADDMIKAAEKNIKEKPSIVVTYETPKSSEVRKVNSKTVASKANSLGPPRISKRIQSKKMKKVQDNAKKAAADMKAAQEQLKSMQALEALTDDINDNMTSKHVSSLSPMENDTSVEKLPDEETHNVQSKTRLITGNTELVEKTDSVSKTEHKFTKLIDEIKTTIDVITKSTIDVISKTSEEAFMKDQLLDHSMFPKNTILKEGPEEKPRKDSSTHVAKNAPVTEVSRTVEVTTENDMEMVNVSKTKSPTHVAKKGTVTEVSRTEEVTTENDTEMVNVSRTKSPTHVAKKGTVTEVSRTVEVTTENDTEMVNVSRTKSPTHVAKKGTVTEVSRTVEVTTENDTEVVKISGEKSPTHVAKKGTVTEVSRTEVTTENDTEMVNVSRTKSPTHVAINVPVTEVSRSVEVTTENDTEMVNVSRKKSPTHAAKKVPVTEVSRTVEVTTANDTEVVEVPDVLTDIRIAKNLEKASKQENKLQTHEVHPKPSVKNNTILTETASKTSEPERKLPEINVYDLTSDSGKKFTEKNVELKNVSGIDKNTPKDPEMSNIPQIYKNSIQFTELPQSNPDPLKKVVRIIMPDSRVFKATVYGKIHVSFDTLFEVPSLKNILMSGLKEKKMYNVNIRNSQMPEVELSKKIPKKVDTINLISDDEDDSAPITSEDNKLISYFSTEFGKYAVKDVDEEMHQKHQSRFSQKCFLKLQKCDILSSLVTDMVKKESLLCKEILDASSSEKDDNSPKEFPTVSEVIDIDDSSNDSDCVPVEVRKVNIDEFKHLLLKDYKDIFTSENDQKIKKCKPSPSTDVTQSTEFHVQEYTTLPTKTDTRESVSEISGCDKSVEHINKLLVSDLNTMVQIDDDSVDMEDLPTVVCDNLVQPRSESTSPVIDISGTLSSSMVDYKDFEAKDMTSLEIADDKLTNWKDKLLKAVPIFCDTDWFVTKRKFYQLTSWFNVDVIPKISTYIYYSQNDELDDSTDCEDMFPESPAAIEDKDITLVKEADDTLLKDQETTFKQEFASLCCDTEWFETKRKHKVIASDVDKESEKLAMTESKVDESMDYENPGPVESYSETSVTIADVPELMERKERVPLYCDTEWFVIKRRLNQITSLVAKNIKSMEPSTENKLDESMDYEDLSLDSYGKSSVTKVVKEVESQKQYIACCCDSEWLVTKRKLNEIRSLETKSIKSEEFTKDDKVIESMDYEDLNHEDSHMKTPVTKAEFTELIERVDSKKTYIPVCCDSESFTTKRKLNKISSLVAKSIKSEQNIESMDYDDLNHEDSHIKTRVTKAELPQVIEREDFKKLHIPLCCDSESFATKRKLNKITLLVTESIKSEKNTVNVDKINETKDYKGRSLENSHGKVPVEKADLTELIESMNSKKLHIPLSCDSELFATKRKLHKITSLVAKSMKSEEFNAEEEKTNEWMDYEDLSLETSHENTHLTKPDLIKLTERAESIERHIPLCCDSECFLTKRNLNHFALLVVEGMIPKEFIVAEDEVNKYMDCKDLSLEDSHEKTPVVKTDVNDELMDVEQHKKQLSPLCCDSEWFVTKQKLISVTSLIDENIKPATFTRADNKLNENVVHGNLIPNDSDSQPLGDMIIINKPDDVTEFIDPEEGFAKKTVPLCCATDWFVTKRKLYKNTVLTNKFTRDIKLKESTDCENLVTLKDSKLQAKITNSVTGNVSTLQQIMVRYFSDNPIDDLKTVSSKTVISPVLLSPALKRKSTVNLINKFNKISRRIAYPSAKLSAKTGKTYNDKIKETNTPGTDASKGNKEVKKETRLWVDGDEIIGEVVAMLDEIIDVIVSTETVYVTPSEVKKKVADDNIEFTYNISMDLLSTDFQDEDNGTDETMREEDKNLCQNVNLDDTICNDDYQDAFSDLKDSVELNTDSVFIKSQTQEEITKPELETSNNLKKDLSNENIDWVDHESIINSDSDKSTGSDSVLESTYTELMSKINDGEQKGTQFDKNVDTTIANTKRVEMLKCLEIKDVETDGQDKIISHCYVNGAELKVKYAEVTKKLDTKNICGDSNTRQVLNTISVNFGDDGADHKHAEYTIDKSQSKFCGGTEIAQITESAASAEVVESEDVHNELGSNSSELNVEDKFQTGIDYANTNIDESLVLEHGETTEKDETLTENNEDQLTESDNQFTETEDQLTDTEDVNILIFSEFDAEDVVTENEKIAQKVQESEDQLTKIENQLTETEDLLIDNEDQLTEDEDVTENYLEITEKGMGNGPNTTSTLVEESDQEINFEDNTLDRNATLIYGDDTGVVLKGIEYEDPVMGTCYVFPLVKSPECGESLDDSCDSNIEVIKDTDTSGGETVESENAPEGIECISPDFPDDLSYEKFKLKAVKDYSSKNRKRKSDSAALIISGKRPRRSRSRDSDTYERCYGKKKLIDARKISAAAVNELTYEKDFRNLIDYYSTQAFSYSLSYDWEHIETTTLLKRWPIKNTRDNEFKDEIEPVELFTDIDRKPYEPEVSKLTLAEELSSNIVVEKTEATDSNFSMGFGEGSGRVIQDLKHLGAFSKFSAATLSDVKHYQPVLLSNRDGESIHETFLCSTQEEQKGVQRFMRNLQVRKKVQLFFQTTAEELNNELLCEKGKDDNKQLYDSDQFPFDAYIKGDLIPSSVDMVVQVVQVGQPPVSAAAQNPVTCDPRVTHVSDASPSQCSVDNSSPNDTEQTIKTEYTELTTANISMPMIGQAYEQRVESGNSALSCENITIESRVIKSEIKIELQEETPEETEFNTEAQDEFKSEDTEVFNNSDYPYEPTDNNNPTQTESNVQKFDSNIQQFDSSQVPLNADTSEQKQMNGISEIPEKTNQIAHAMNAAGITADEDTNGENGTDTLVNLLTQNMCPSNVTSTQNSTIVYPRTTSINAMSLQQALAQLLPQSSNQTAENNQSGLNSVLHIVQSKNPSGNIALVENNQQSVINSPKATPVLHIVQNKATNGCPSSNVSPAHQQNTFSGLSLVDAGLQQGANLLHIVNTGNQKNSNTGQLLKRVNLVTNLTNVQGSNEQKMLQFVCKSADGKSIQLNAPHQRSMVLRLQPIETPNVQTPPQKPLENQDMNPTATNASPHKDNDASQQEIKSRSVYEENYAKFIQNSGPEKSTSLPKFNQAFGKPVFEDGDEKESAINSSESIANPENENGQCQNSENAINLDHITSMTNPPLLLRKPPAQVSQAQANLVQQLKQTIAPMNIQTMHGGVIYTRQIPVNIGGGQTINLISVPSSELIDESGQKPPEVKFVNQGDIEPSIIKIVPQTQAPLNADVSQEDGNASMQNDGQNPQPQPVLTQMRIKLPMLSKNPQLLAGARVVRPSFFQIQRNVIGGANQPVYQQLVLTAAPPIGQQTIRLPQPQTQAKTGKAPDNQSPTESQMSSSTLEQLREFDMVLEQVKERSTVQPGASTSNTFTLNAQSTDSTDSPVSTASTPAETTQVLYSIGGNQSLSVTYGNRKSTVTTVATNYARSPDSSGVADSSSSSTQGQTSHTVTAETAQTIRNESTPPKPAGKVHSKSRSKSKSSSHSSNTVKVNTVTPPKPSTQKPLEDEQTTQRILYILAEYKEQVENSPDKDKPAPRRRTNPPSNSGSSRRKKRRSGARDVSPVQGEDTCRTMGSEDSSCGTSQGDCTENCFETNSPQSSPRKVIRKLTFDQDSTSPPTPQPPRNVIVADSQSITVARGTTGKPATAVIMPTNYILPVSMMKGGQQIAIVTSQGPRILTVSGGESPAANALLLQRLIGPAGLKPVLTRPGIRHVRLPAAALQRIQAFNLATAAAAEGAPSTAQSSQPPDSAASPAPEPTPTTPPDPVEPQASTSPPWADRESESDKPERPPSPEGSEPWNIPSSADPHEYNYEDTVRNDNLDRTVLEAIPDRYSPDMEAHRIFDKMFDVESKKCFVDSPRCGYDIDASDCEDKTYQVVHKKDMSAARQHRLAHVSALALRHKYAILEHELRLQKSLSEECEDLGVDSPSASDLFPEAELLFSGSPAAHDHGNDNQAHHANIPQQPIMSQPIPDHIEEQIAPELLPQDRDMDLGLEDDIPVTDQGIPALDHEEFARSHPNTTFHSEPTDDGEVQPFTLSGLKTRHITSAIFHPNRTATTVLMTAPQATVISQNENVDHVKYSNMDMMHLPQHSNLNLNSVLVKDEGLTRFDSILTDSRELHLSNTASTIVHSCNATQVIRRVCYEDDKRERERFLIDEPESIIAGKDAKMVAEDNSRDATLDSLQGDVDEGHSSPERPELFWESNSASERSESRRPLDFSSDSEKCCKSPLYDETNSTDSSVGTHMRLDSVIKEARVVERSCSADGSSADDTHPPLRTYPPKRSHHVEGPDRSLSGKTRAGEGHQSPDVRRRASNRGVVKRGCHCCNGSPAPSRPKKPRQKKTAHSDTTNNH